MCAHVSKIKRIYLLWLLSPMETCRAQLSKNLESRDCIHSKPRKCFCSACTARSFGERPRNGMKWHLLLTHRSAAHGRPWLHVFGSPLHACWRPCAALAQQTFSRSVINLFKAGETAFCYLPGSASTFFCTKKKRQKKNR